jgi:phage replication O-like protein O
MANPQTGDGYTKIANEILDALCRTRIPGEEMQVVNAILRKTYGYGKCEDIISLGQLSQMTGINRPNVARALKSLLSKKITLVIKSDNRGANLLKFNKDYEQWVLSKKIAGVIKKDNKVLSKMIPTKEKKEIKDSLLSPISGNGSCPHQEIIDIYHELLPQLPKVIKWTDKRMKLLRKQWNDSPDQKNITWWRDYFVIVTESPFLLGKNNSGWRADLEWLIKPDNLPKVLEGKYKDKDNEYRKPDILDTIK